MSERLLERENIMLTKSFALIPIAALLIACGPASPAAQQETPIPDAVTPVAFQNPGYTPVPLPDHCECGVYDAGANAIGWTVRPVIQAGALLAEGTVAAGFRLSDPLAGEPPAFMVHFGNNTEVLLVMLPDLAPTYIWDTDHTVAPMDLDQQNGHFSLRGYSPLFMDVGAGDYRLVVWGYDADGQRVVLSIQSVE